MDKSLTWYAIHEAKNLLRLYVRTFHIRTTWLQKTAMKYYTQYHACLILVQKQMNPFLSDSLSKQHQAATLSFPIPSFSVWANRFQKRYICYTWNRSDRPERNPGRSSRENKRENTLVARSRQDSWLWTSGRRTRQVLIQIEVFF